MVVSSLSAWVIFSQPLELYPRQQVLGLQQLDQYELSWPQDQLRFGQVAILLKANNLDSRAQEVIIDGLEKFPNEFGLWRVLSELSTATPEQITDAKKQMKRLDPLNPELK